MKNESRIQLHGCCPIVGSLRAVGGIALIALVACASEPPPPPPVALKSTPENIEQSFVQLLETVDEARPGAAVTALRAFKAQNDSFEIATLAASEIKYFEDLAVGRFHEARGLAREGEFARAELMLEDLATYLPETRDGRSAAEHLKFDFHMGQAQWLMIRQRSEEAGLVAQRLVGRTLTPTQMQQLETMLDLVGNYNAAMGQAERAQARAACQQLRVMLATIYVEEGSYPRRMSLDELPFEDTYGLSSIRQGLSAIENYRGGRDDYSFVAVSVSGAVRLRVNSGDIEEI